MYRPFRSILAVYFTMVLMVLGWSPLLAHAEEDQEARNDSVHTANSLRAALLFEGEHAFEQHAQAALGTRSVPLAFGMSALVPGLGQAYNKQWIKAGIALAAEVALIVGYSTWHSRGVDGRDAYQIYAEEFWSPTQYAYWLNDYKNYLEVEFGTPISGSSVNISSEVLNLDFSQSGSWTSAQRAAVKSLFDQIRALETTVYHPETGATFSHRLPFFGEQQYYELVGKYFQFAPGWSDYEFRFDANGNPTWVDENGNFIATIDPEVSGPNGTKPNVSDQFFDYAQDHGDANDNLLRASRLTVVFFANHFLSAIDAALFARLHNNRLQASVDMTYNQYGEPEPKATLTLLF